MKHTPGPWKISIATGDHYYRYKGFPTVTDNEGFDIAICPDEKKERNSKANARLIAAAPELLETCEAVSIFIEDNIENLMFNTGGQIFKERLSLLNTLVKQAISKAEEKE